MRNSERPEQNDVEDDDVEELDGDCAMEEHKYYVNGVDDAAAEVIDDEHDEEVFWQEDRQRHREEDGKGLVRQRMKVKEVLDPRRPSQKEA